MVVIFADAKVHYFIGVPQHGDSVAESDILTTLSIDCYDDITSFKTTSPNVTSWN